MKCSELFRLLKKEGWYPVSQKGSHVKMKHDTRTGVIIISKPWQSGNWKRTGEENTEKCRYQIVNRN